MILINNHLQEDSSLHEEIFNEGFNIYEVIRVFKSNTIFLNDNIERLKNSISKSKLYLSQDINDFVNSLNIPEKLKKIIEANHIQEGNLKYILKFNNNDNSDTNSGISYDEYVFQIPHSYPSAETYMTGIETLTLKATRNNPEIKYINPTLRQESNRIMEEKKVFELLLVNEESMLTEGSRSNLFFVKDTVLYTASTEYVLPGTSRKRVFEICKRLNIKIIEECVRENEIQNYDAAFISGTSPLVLPIAKINDITFNVNNKTMRTIMEEYFKMLK